MRVDERGREDQPGAVDHPVLVGVQARPELGDRAAVDAHVADRVEPLRRVEYSRAANEHVSLAAALRPEHQATSSGSGVFTGTGPVVSRS